MSAETSWPGAIRALLGELTASGIEEFEFAGSETRLRIRRQPGRVTLAAPAAAIEALPGLTLDAPLSGIFYRAASPTAEPFVREGDEFAPGQPIALIEAMKVFNEVRADHPGRVLRFLAENGRLVQAGDPLLEYEEVA
jgi:acetyl-CoA carboxylase biotin carboxyl carrier protein